MSFFEFPHTRTYDSDLGWLIKHFKLTAEQVDTLEKWAAVHKAEYEELSDKVDGLINNLVDVIVPWDSSIAYHIFSIVEYQGTNYIAVQDVPVGAMITNTEYWQPANTALEQINAIGVTVDEVKNDQRLIFDTVSDMQQYDAETGKTVITLGYYAVGDRGDAVYDISETALYQNEYMSIPLDNGLYANLKIADIENRTERSIKAESIGCKAEDPTFDNAPIVNLITNDVNYYNYTLTFGSNRFYFKTTVLDPYSVSLIGTLANWMSGDDTYNRTIFHFSGNGLTSKTAIKFNNHGAIKNIHVFGEYVTSAEDRTVIGTTGAINRNWLTFTASIADTIGIDCRKTGNNFTCLIEECVVEGFSYGVYMALLSNINRCRFDNIDTIAVIMANDCIIHDCLFQKVNTCIYSANLAQISNIRGDSIKSRVININGTGNIIDNIVGDYVGAEVVRVSGATASGANISNVSGRSGIDYVGSAYADLAWEDKIKDSLISFVNVLGVNVSNIDGRARNLDSGTAIGNKVIYAYQLRGAQIEMSGRVVDKLAPTDLPDYVTTANNSTFTLIIGAYTYVYQRSSSADANVYTPTLAALT